MLELRDLSVFIQTNNSEKEVVSHVNLTVPQGKIVGIVGESGSGKSMLCNAIMQLFRQNRRYTGDIVYKGTSLLAKSEREMRHLRGKEISLIMQNPMAMFNPIVKIGDHFVETLQSHERISKHNARKRAAEQLARFQLPEEELLDRYPHELSGGMLQRIMIALAACMQPNLLIADEPTTALDTMTQMDILDELLHFHQKTKTSMLIVSHDLGVIAKMADFIVVMRRGVIVEYGPAEWILAQPAHSYTQALLAARDEHGDLEKLADSWEGTTIGPLYEYKPGCWVREEG
ncbi:ABC transporter ATP-binding protein [Domibacillus sp. 8LH]|uniref:ABC transporter ATP-binding protein n=1 Tax=Domibacillus sp. 8LH TaxID=3073900 RepID=UPI00317FD0FC